MPTRPDSQSSSVRSSEYRHRRTLYSPSNPSIPNKQTPSADNRKQQPDSGETFQAKKRQLQDYIAEMNLRECSYYDNILR